MTAGVRNTSPGIPRSAATRLPTTLGMTVMLLLAIAWNFAAAVPEGDITLVLTHVAVVDPAGGPTQPDRTVIIRGGRIVRVEPSAGAAPEKSATVVDGRGKFLIPGLWDMHVHLSWATSGALPALVANGVTGVRDLGSNLAEIDDWRARIAAGVLVGPAIFRAGPILNGKSFNKYQLVTGNPDQTRGVARALKFAGVDLLKVHRRMERESYFALIEEAKAQGLPVVGHIPMTVSPEEASDAGQAIEHTETLFEGTFAAGLKENADLSDAIARFRAENGEKLFARFVRNGTRVTPALAAYRSILLSIDPAASEDPNARYVAGSVKREFASRMGKGTPEEVAGTKRTLHELSEVVRQMRASGVTLMAGTDLAGPRVPPGFTLHEELALLVESGLSPVEALRSATTTPAAFLKASADYGSVEAGKRADLVLLDADPLADIRNTRKIRAVVLNGKLLDRASLDRLLREAEEQAKQK